MRLGLVTYQMAQDWDLDTCIEMCAKTGFDGLELRTTHAHGVEPSLSAKERAEVKRKFDDSPVMLWGLGTACEYHSPNQDEVKRHVHLTKDFVDLGADLGAVGVKVRPNGLPEEVPVEKTLEQIGTALRECGQYAADKGQEIWLEVHGGGTSHVPHIKTIMEVCDHPQVFVCWNCNPGEVEGGSIRQNFELVGRWVRETHIHDLYDKSYPWKELFGLLRQHEFDGMNLLEGPGSSDPERVMSYYSALYREMTQPDPYADRSAVRVSHAR